MGRAPSETKRRRVERTLTAAARDTCFLSTLRESMHVEGSVTATRAGRGCVDLRDAGARWATLLDGPPGCDSPRDGMHPCRILRRRGLAVSPDGAGIAARCT
jgi:hypothetical protein